jgi:hypothetical protein
MSVSLKRSKALRLPLLRQASFSTPYLRRLARISGFISVDFKMKNAAETDATLSRQKRVITILAVALIIAGALLLFVLKRAPLPLRILAGLGDVFAGCVLLVLVRQKFGR